MTSQEAPERYDELHVFQAAPLVWRDGEGELNPVEWLDCDRERQILAESVRAAGLVGAEIGLVFEAATTDRLGNFLATSEARAVHVSCHGYPDCLCFEDGSGGVQLVTADDLRAFVSAGTNDLSFVFVSACYSRSIGESFVKAGARHVVCCEQDEPLLDVATIEFSRSFYRALSCGRSLKQSFELAIQALKLSPLVPDSSAEVGKFLLLPEDSDDVHDVPIFFTKPLKRKTDSGVGLRSLSAYRALPQPPSKFVGREMDMYCMIQSIQQARLIKLMGPPGIGKRSLAAAVCHYVKTRLLTFSIDRIIWLPLMSTLQADTLETAFQTLLNSISSGCNQEKHQADSYGKCLSSIVEACSESNVIFVVDMEMFNRQTEADQLSTFLRDLFRRTRYARVVTIVHGDLKLPLENICIESGMSLAPLGFHATTTLFGILCPFVAKGRHSAICTPGQLSKLLVPAGQEHFRTLNEGLTKRSFDTFALLGKGIPSLIHSAARKMTLEEFGELAARGERREFCANCETRAELNQKLSAKEEELQNAVAAQSFTLAQNLQEDIDELTMLCGTLPTLNELRSSTQALRESLKRAVVEKDFHKAKHIQDKLELQEEQMKREEAAISQLSAAASASFMHATDNETSPYFSTRCELETEIRKLERSLEVAAQNRKFREARSIQQDIFRLEQSRQALPSRSDLATDIAARNTALEKAIHEKDFVVAEGLYAEILELEGKLEREKEKEAELPVASKARLLAQDYQKSSMSKHLADAETGVITESMNTKHVSSVKRSPHRCQREKAMVEESVLNKGRVCTMQANSATRYKRFRGECSQQSSSATSLTPFLALWPMLTNELQGAFYGALVQHGIVSTRKALAAIRGVDQEVRRFLDQLDRIAPGAETVPSSQDSCPVDPPKAPLTCFKCSPCVERAAQSFLDENDGLGPVAKVGPKAFFLKVVQTSTGEFMCWWRKAGLSEDIVASHVLRVAALTFCGNSS